MTLALVIPAYNERHTIAEVVARCRRVCEAIYVVDDGSTDGTGRVLENLPVTVIAHPENRGKAASLVAGMRAAIAEGANAVVTLDGDLQHRPEDIPRLVAAHKGNPTLVAIGSRFERPGRIPVVRRLANKFANYWISIACGMPIRDSQSGFRLYPRRLIENIPVAQGLEASFVFESEILIDAARAGSGRHSHYRGFRDTVRIFRMVARKILSGPKPPAHFKPTQRRYESGSN